MKTVWKSFLRDACRPHEWSEEERTALSHYEHLRRHFPAMEAFRVPSPTPSLSATANLELPSQYQVTGLTSSSPCSSTTREWTAIRHDTEGKEQDVPCRVFMKIIHLLHPVDYLRREHPVPSHPLLPSCSSSAWNRTTTKLHHRNNQAYVDAVANFVLSRYRERGLLPHLVLYYGSYTGISRSYRYNLTGEYESYRRYRWFWEGMKAHQSRLTLVHRVEEDVPKGKTEYEEWRKEITECPLEEELCSDKESSHSSRSSRSSRSSCSSRVEAEEFESLPECDSLSSLCELNLLEEVDTLEDMKETEDVKEAVDTKEVVVGEIESDLESEAQSESETDSEEVAPWMEETDIYLEIPQFPVLMILQEHQEGSMDQLLDEEVLDGHARGSVEWEKRWVAWLFQVTATLTFLQEALSFTHNDLHTNNLLWRTTDKPYLYYRLKGKKGVWRVPTYGKIFSIIDFGRSIFRIGKHQWISDDHWPNEDAAGQYNFGPFYDKNQPRVEPNPSFDLCRLSVSLLSGLFDEPPPKKRGKHIGVLSEEGSWKVYETRSPLYNLLWRWTIDDAGRTVYENRHGEERYEGFDLYIHIAHHVHGAVPREQLHQGIFQGFLWKQPIPVGETVYGLDA